MNQGVHSENGPELKGLHHFQADAGERLTVLGEAVIFKTLGEHTGGAYSIFELISLPGGGTPPHVHTRESETFYVLEGEVEFYAGGKRMQLHAGEIAVAPPHIPHNFTNIGSAPLRMLVYVQPAGLEHFFRDAARLAFPPHPESAAAVCGKYGIELLPPWQD